MKNLGSLTALFISLLTFSRRQGFKNKGKITVEMIGHNSWYHQSSWAEALPAHGCDYGRDGGNNIYTVIAHYCNWQNKYMPGEENSPSPPNDPPHFPTLNRYKSN